MKRAFFALLALLMLAACTVEQEPTEPERALFLTEADFRSLGVQAAASSGGEYRKTLNRLDRSRELVYTFKGQDFYLSNILKFDSSSTYAFITEKAQKVGLMIGFQPYGIEEQPMTPHTKYGDRSSLAMLTKDGKPVGNVFTVVSGGKVFLVVFSGIHFSNPAEFDRFISTKVDAFVKYDADGSSVNSTGK